MQDSLIIMLGHANDLQGNLSRNITQPTITGMTIARSSPHL